MLSKILLKNNGTTPIDLWTVTDKHCIVPAMRVLTYIEEELTMASENLVRNLVTAGVLECTKGVAPAFKYKPKLSTNDPVVGSNIILDSGQPGSLPAPRIEIKWFADGVQIDGEYKSGFKPRAEHAGKKIYCSIKASNIMGSVQDQTDETNQVKQKA